MEFNENLAAFIEEEGTKRYLQKTYGMDSDIYKDYLISLERSKKRIVFLKEALEELNVFYQQHRDCRKIKEVREEKFTKIEEAFHRAFNCRIKVNNAYMANVALYHIDYEDLQEIYNGRFKGDLKAFITHYRDKHGS
jgi:predicted aminopeptidase